MAEYPSSTPTGTYTDDACQTGDSSDKHNMGLLLAKTGPSTDTTDPRGSHCGAGSPRFIVVTSSGSDVIGCNSPHPDEVTPGNGFMRLRWHVNEPDVQAIYVLSDEGQDTGPDNFGVSILDNLDVNGTLVGQGARDAD